MKRMAAVLAALSISGTAFALDRGETTQLQWGPSVDIRNWRGHDVVLLPPWQSVPSALGQDDTSGHIP